MSWDWLLRNDIFMAEGPISQCNKRPRGLDALLGPISQCKNETNLWHQRPDVLRKHFFIANGTVSAVCVYGNCYVFGLLWTLHLKCSVSALLGNLISLGNTRGGFSTLQSQTPFGMGCLALWYCVLPPPPPSHVMSFLLLVYAVGWVNLWFCLRYFSRGEGCIS